MTPEGGESGSRVDEVFSQISDSGRFEDLTAAFSIFTPAGLINSRETSLHATSSPPPTPSFVDVGELCCVVAAVAVFVEDEEFGRAYPGALRWSSSCGSSSPPVG